MYPFPIGARVSGVAGARSFVASDLTSGSMVGSKFLSQRPQAWTASAGGAVVGPTLFERMLIDDGIILLKYSFSVSDEEQERRFQDRLNTPLKRWKLSEKDLEGRNRWVAYSRAKDEMLDHCDLPDSPWYEVETDEQHVGPAQLYLTPPVSRAGRSPQGSDGQASTRPPVRNYRRPSRDRYHSVPDYAATPS